VRNRARPWIINGLVLGAIISSACVLFGVITQTRDSLDLLSENGVLVCLLVPLYTAIWYVARAFHAVRTQPVNSVRLTIALASSLPFWAVSVWWSYKTYLSLPDHVDRCFVVTAASRGHRRFVGPFLNVRHRGCTRVANRQLAIFWAFEALWRKHAPLTHRTFRHVYNIVGPRIARRIRSPWWADAIYLSLKPAEFFARFVVNANSLLAVKNEASLPRLLHS
jgi:hypothetical protein